MLTIIIVTFFVALLGFLINLITQAPQTLHVAPNIGKSDIDTGEDLLGKWFSPPPAHQ
jgi:hypothetical protein